MNYDFDSSRDKGIRDLALAFRRTDIWLSLGWHDIRQRYRRSMLGPLWITITLGVQVAGIAYVYSQLFKLEISSYLPFLAVGLTVWTLISGALTEGTMTFINSASSIRSVVAPVSVHFLRLMAQHVIIFGHNLIVVLIVYAAFRFNPGPIALLALPGFVLCLLNLAWIVLCMAILAARFRDISLIVTSSIVLLLLVTPIMWRPEMVGRDSFFVAANPFYYLVEVIRAPLLGGPIFLTDWVCTTVAAVAGWAVTLLLFERFHSRIAYWI